MSFRNQKRKNDTGLSTFLWEFKKSTKETPKLTWSVLKVVPAYTNISKRCLLCLNDKLLSATYPDQKQLLNKRSELIAKCRHENKFLLMNYKTNESSVVSFLKKRILHIEYFQEKFIFT